MPKTISDYFLDLELWLLQLQSISSYLITQKGITDESGYIRLRVFLTNSDLVELFEYVLVHQTHIRVAKYSYHWQTNGGNVRLRWDNAFHHRHLPNAPHHAHGEDGSVRALDRFPTISNF